MDKRFQVFISSTFVDLQEERQAAVQAILESGHIPAGMELFTAGNETQLDVVKKWIHESDIYMLILGGRYGSIEPKSKKSYTHIEYEYAQQLKKPMFAVVLSDSMLHKKASMDSKTDYFERQNSKPYKDFKKLVLSKMSRFIEEIKDINIAVLASLYEISKNPNLDGWVRELNQRTPKTVFHKCYKCGKEELLPDPSSYETFDSNFVKFNRWHKINIDTPCYGSTLDKIDVNFELCDECLVNLIDGLKHKELIYGDETWGPTPDDFEHKNVT